MKNLQQVISGYLDKYLLWGEKIAIALSGGIDSMALYEIMKKVKKPDLVIHVHHGMRKESDFEALEIEKILQLDAIQYEIVYLGPIDLKVGNVEDRLRKLRFESFKKILSERNIKHLFTAHQQGDVEENIFKRILEGASLFKIANFLAPGNLGGVILHKPLIDCPKTLLKNFLDQNNKIFFEDHTNFDNRYLRSRMRQEIFPFLNNSFGKNIDGKFSQLGAELLEMNEWVSTKLSFHFNDLITNTNGIFFPRKEMSRFEIKWVVQKILDKIEETISFDCLNMLLDSYFQKHSNKQFILKNYTVYVEKSGLFFVLKNFKFSDELIDFSLTKFSISDFWNGIKTGFKKENIPYFIRSQILKY